MLFYNPTAWNEFLSAGTFLAEVMERNPAVTSAIIGIIFASCVMYFTEK